MKNVVTSPHRGELCEISSFRVVTPQPTSNIPSQRSNSSQKAVKGQENCQDDSSATQEKILNLSFAAREKLQWNYINIFIASLFAAAVKIYLK